jgi:mono/diheme cytochrome c family protein
MRAAIASAILLLTACTRPPVGFDRLADDDVAHGERLARVLGCVGCHGNDLTGQNWSDELGVLWTANITQSAARYDNDQLKSMLVSGREPGGRALWDMPSHLFTKLNPDELDALVAYVRSRPVKGEIHPLPRHGPELVRKLKAGVYRSSAERVRQEGMEEGPAAGSDHELGRHIARATCAECHGIDLQGGPEPVTGKVRPDGAHDGRRLFS